MIAATLNNGQKIKIYSPIIKNLHITADNVIHGFSKRGLFTGVIHDSVQFDNARVDDNYRIVVLENPNMLRNQTYTGLITDSHNGAFITKFKKIYEELRIHQYNPARDPKSIHDLIIGIMPTAKIKAVVRDDYGMHWLPGYSISLCQHGIGEFFMNFDYSGELIGLSCYPTCGKEVDISKMDMNALYAFYEKSQNKYYEEIGM